jgi:hypothetical protein
MCPVRGGGAHRAGNGPGRVGALSNTDELVCWAGQLSVAAHLQTLRQRGRLAAAAVPLPHDTPREGTYVQQHMQKLGAIRQGCGSPTGGKCQWTGVAVCTLPAAPPAADLHKRTAGKSKPRG